MAGMYDHLPPKEDLKVPEFGVSSPVMFAASQYLGAYCENQCLEFSLCKEETMDPGLCFKDGLKVTDCAREFFGLVKGRCAQQLAGFADCIDHQRYPHARMCRKSQIKFENCMLDEFGMKRPPFGYFAKNRFHYTTRPKPDNVYTPHVVVDGPVDPEKLQIPKPHAVQKPVDPDLVKELPMEKIHFPAAHTF